MKDIAKPVIALPVGDPQGIGPEISVRAASDPAVLAACEPQLIGDPEVLEAAANATGCALEPDRLVRVKSLNSSPAFGSVDGAAGKATVDYACTAINLACNGKVDAVVAAPHNETAVAAAGIPFSGYPSLLARETGIDPSQVRLMLVTPRFRIVHQTLHVGLRAALDSLSVSRVYDGIVAVHDALSMIMMDQPKIGVFGINPHAGEDGLFGPEDEEVTRPACHRARETGIDVLGPAGADLLLQENVCDGYLAMFHDQGHIPAKLEGREAVIGLSIGTPVLFSSVAHGSAHDIAGKGLADAKPLINVLLGMAKIARMKKELA